jgi:putative ABC transport system permease protein
MSRWKFLIRKRSLDQQLDSELRYHIEELTAENLAAGMAPEEARRRAILEFGGPEQVKEELREVYGVRIIETTLANLKSAFRFIRKSPSFSLAIILTLALGIGANSAVFSAIDAILLRPLPFPNGDQLTWLYQYRPKAPNPETHVAPVRLEDWNRMNSTFQAITGYFREDESETSGAIPEEVTRAWVAPRFLQVWGVAPALGRDFNSDEERFGGPNAVLISDRFWRRRFGGDPNAVGKTLRFEINSSTIVGIMPASFLFPDGDVDLWSPSPVDAPFSQSRESTWYRVIGRLKQGMTVTKAQADLATVQGQLGKAYPKTDADMAVGIELLKEVTVGGVRRSLWMLFGSVTLLLLIACTNIVALLLARAAQRQHEISIRFSLGATRARIIGQLLAEAFVLALAGAGLGLLVAGGAAEIFRTLGGKMPRVEEIHLDWRIVAYSLGCSVAATLLCGLLPAIRGTRSGISQALAQENRTQVSGRNPLQWLLVGVQVALAVTLLAGAGLLVRSFQELGRVSPGFDSSHVLTFHISASWGETTDMKGLSQRIDRILDSVRNLPGVEGTATAASLPGVEDKYATEVRITEGQANPNEKIFVESRFVSPGYFGTMRIPLLEGGLCREEPGLTCVDVNRSFVNTYLAGSLALGHHVVMPSNSFLPSGVIRGIVGDAREEGINHEPVPTVYWSISAPGPDPYYLVRTHARPMMMAESIRKKIHEIEPGRSVFQIMPLDEHLDEAFAEARLRTILLEFFAITAVSLACVGLYGTLSYSVQVRRREVGLRLALGALRGQIVKQFLLQGLRVTVLGCLAGACLAVAFARVLSGMLYGVTTTDPLTLSGVVLLVVGVAGVASLFPALRAARVDPMQVLRDE